MLLLQICLSGRCQLIHLFYVLIFYVVKVKTNFTARNDFSVMEATIEMCIHELYENHFDNCIRRLTANTA